MALDPFSSPNITVESAIGFPPSARAELLFGIRIDVFGILERLHRRCERRLINLSFVVPEIFFE
jgi:hypothetical protein